MGTGVGEIIYISDEDENAQRVSTAGRAFVSEGYAKVKNHFPINVTSASGGSTFETASIGRLMIYSQSGNGIMWWGGTGDDAPYSGHGMPLWGGETTDLIPVTNFNTIRITASLSGQIVYAIGFLNNVVDIPIETTVEVVQPDVTVPTVVSHVPVSGLSGISFDQDMSVIFSEPISNLASGVFKLSPAHNVTLYVDPSNSSRIVMEPNVNLSGSTVYMAEVTTAITDLVGNNLASGLRWPFTTTATPPPPDTTPPVVSGTTPVSGTTSVNITSNVTVLFSEQMLSGTINTNTIFLSTTSGAASPGDVTSTISLDAADKKTVTLDPTNSLANGTTYNINVTTGVQDLAGNPMSTVDRSRWFSTTSQFTEIYNVTGGTTTSFGSNTSRWYEKVTGSCTLLNTTPKRMTVKLAKVGSPTGTLTVNVYEGTGSTISSLTKHQIGSIDVSTLTTTLTDYTFTNLSQSHQLVLNERIGIEWTGFSSLPNTIEFSATTTSVYNNATLQYGFEDGNIYDYSGADLVATIYS